MTREDMIDAAFAGDEIADISQIDDDDDDDDDDFDIFSMRSVTPRKRRSGAQKRRRRKWQHALGRAFNQPDKPDPALMNSLERFVILGIEHDGSDWRK